MKLIEALQDPKRYNHEVTHFELIETHISWVLLTGKFAYKIKKPVNFGFLDFSTLNKRHYYCQEEIRLNRRLAPEIYLEVIPISGTETEPLLDNSEPVIEYAVKMAQFPHHMQLDLLADRNELLSSHMVAAAEEIANFHRHIAVAESDSDYSNVESSYQPVLANYRAIIEQLPQSSDLKRVLKLKAWSQSSHSKLSHEFDQRKINGYIRECHGDIHLHNMALVNNKILIFDCIEFNENLRWIDVMSEVAFLVMDLQNRKQAGLAFEFLNRYLELTGDYRGITVLRYYLSYRAMVRAKVDCLRASQADLNPQQINQIVREFRSYLSLAESYTSCISPAIIIMHGLSGSGKTVISGKLVETIFAIRIRSDLERKRLHGFDEQAKTNSPINEHIYSKQATDNTYVYLLEIAEIVVQSGYSIIIDAAFLKQQQRQLFIDLAARINVVFAIIDCQAPYPQLQRRVSARLTNESDASEANLAVLDGQIQSQETLTKKETECCISIDSRQAIDMPTILSQLEDMAALLKKQD